VISISIIKIATGILKGVHLDFIYLSILSKDRVVQMDKPATILPIHIHATHKKKKLQGQNKEQYKNKKYISKKKMTEG